VASIREDIEHDLSRSGSQLVALKRLWLYLPAIFTSQLSRPAAVYRATAKSAHGEPITRVYAYDFLGWGELGRPGLKRYAQPGWVDAD
jgi:hypothetical protein